MTRYLKHIFICENQRDPQTGKKSCGVNDSADIRKEMKRILVEKGLHKTFRANGAACLGACEYGPVMVIYPQGIWYAGISQEDIPEIIEESILNDRVIARLQLQDKQSRKL